MKNLEPKIRRCFFVFNNLEKDLNQVPREVICFALRRKGVQEYLVNGVMSLYKVCKLLSQLIGNYQVYFL